MLNVYFTKNMKIIASESRFQVLGRDQHGHKHVDKNMSSENLLILAYSENTFNLRISSLYPQQAS